MGNLVWMLHLAGVDARVFKDGWASSSPGRALDIAPIAISEIPSGVHSTPPPVGRESGRKCSKSHANSDGGMRRHSSADWEALSKWSEIWS